MRILLDTHIFLWFISGDPQLSISTRELIQDSEIMSGVPVFIGTRVPLQTLFDYLEGEGGLNEFLEDFPHLQTSALQVLETIARVTLHHRSSCEN